MSLPTWDLPIISVQKWRKHAEKYVENLYKKGLVAAKRVVWCSVSVVSTPTLHTTKLINNQLFKYHIVQCAIEIDNWLSTMWKTVVYNFVAPCVVLCLAMAKSCPSRGQYCIKDNWQVNTALYKVTWMNCLFKETKNLHFILLCAKINVILQHKWGYTLLK